MNVNPHSVSLLNYEDRVLYSRIYDVFKRNGLKILDSPNYQELYVKNPPRFYHTIIPQLCYLSRIDDFAKDLLYSVKKRLELYKARGYAANPVNIMSRYSNVRITMNETARDMRFVFRVPSDRSDQSDHQSLKRGNGTKRKAHMSSLNGDPNGNSSIKRPKMDPSQGKTILHTKTDVSSASKSDTILDEDRVLNLEESSTKGHGDGSDKNFKFKEWEESSRNFVPLNLTYSTLLEKPSENTNEVLNRLPTPIGDLPIGGFENGEMNASRVKSNGATNIEMQLGDKVASTSLKVSKTDFQKLREESTAVKDDVILVDSGSDTCDDDGPDSPKIRIIFPKDFNMRETADNEPNELDELDELPKEKYPDSSSHPPRIREENDMTSDTITTAVDDRISGANSRDLKMNSGKEQELEDYERSAETYRADSGVFESASPQSSTRKQAESDNKEMKRALTEEKLATNSVELETLVGIWRNRRIILRSLKSWRDQVKKALDLLFGIGTKLNREKARDILRSLSKDNVIAQLYIAYLDDLEGRKESLRDFIRNNKNVMRLAEVIDDKTHFSDFLFVLGHAFRAVPSQDQEGMAEKYNSLASKEGHLEAMFQVSEVGGRGKSFLRSAAREGHIGAAVKYIKSRLENPSDRFKRVNDIALVARNLSEFDFPEHRNLLANAFAKLLDFERALALYKRDIENPKSCYELAKLIYEGRIDGFDKLSSLEYFKRADDAGYKEAGLFLGLYFFQNEKDPSIGLGKLEELSNHGYVDASYALAQYYEAESMKELAYGYYKKAAVGEHRDSCLKYAIYALESGCEEPKSTIRYLKASKTVESKYYIGMVEQKKGKKHKIPPKSFVKKLEILFRTASKVIPEANFRIAQLNEGSLGDTELERLYEIAAEEGGAKKFHAMLKLLELKEKKGTMDGSSLFKEYMELYFKSGRNKRVAYRIAKAYIFGELDQDFNYNEAHKLLSDVKLKNTLGSYLMGHMTENGLGVRSDPKGAQIYYEKYIEYFNRDWPKCVAYKDRMYEDAHYRLGRTNLLASGVLFSQYFDKELVKSAKKNFVFGKKRKHFDSICALAFLHLKGYGYRKDVTRAMELYGVASSVAPNLTQVKLGIAQIFTENGNNREAYALFKELADKGSVKAMNNVAVLLFNMHRGTELFMQAADEIYKYFDRAVTKGSATGEYLTLNHGFVRILMTRKSTARFNRALMLESERRFSDAISEYRSICASSTQYVETAALRLGYLYENTDNKRDIPAAKEYYTKSVQNGNGRAAFFLAMMLEAENKNREAKTMFEIASDRGIPEAKNNLAYIMNNVENNSNAARKLYKEAASGCEVAKKNYHILSSRNLEI